MYASNKDKISNNYDAFLELPTTLKDINSDKIEIFPKDTKSEPNKTLRSAIELNKLGINLVIGPVFYNNIIWLHI